jgi:hypothetical protein
LKKITLHKLGNDCFVPSPKDLEDLAEQVKNNSVTFTQAEHGYVKEEIYRDDLEDIALVRIEASSSVQDLEYWKKMFEDHQYDKDFTIFTHSEVHIETIKKPDVIIVTSNVMVINQ